MRNASGHAKTAADSSAANGGEVYELAKFLLELDTPGCLWFTDVNDVAGSAMAAAGAPAFEGAVSGKGARAATSI